MTSTFDSTTRTRTIAAAIGAILLALSAPVAHAAPNDGPGTEPWPPNVPSDQYPSLALPPLQASQNPVVFYGADTKKNVQLTWTPYTWAPVIVRFEAVDSGKQHAGYSAEVDPSVTDPHWSLEVYCCRTYEVYLQVPFTGPVGPTLTITTVKIELASTDPPPLRVNPTPIPGDNPHPELPGTRRLDPGAAAPNTRERTVESSQGEDSKTR